MTLFDRLTLKLINIVKLDPNPGYINFKEFFLNK
jgi:hypothetical protein